MTLAGLAGVFGVIFVLELPDKTMIATVVLAARSRPRAVFAGASGAFIVQMALAAVAGSLLARLPTTPKEWLEAALFLGGAAYLLFVRESSEQGRGEREADRGMRRGALGEAATAFVVVFLGEFGDLTQIQAANLVARTHQALEVFCGATAALVATAAIASFAGQRLVRVVPLTRVRQLGGVIFAGLGVYSVVQAVGA